MKRFISIMLCAAMLLSLSVAAFAESGEILTMKMDRNGRSVYYEDGSRAPYSVWEEVMEQFHWLRDEHGVNWDLFSYEEMTFEMDDSGHVTALSQYIIANDGRKIEISDPKVAFIDNPAKIHAIGAGEAQLTVYDPEGNVLNSSEISVTGASFSSYALINECGKCGQDQGMGSHLMSCAHFSCEVGTAGHGDAPCGTAGHYGCDGDDHSRCYNCLKPLCNGKEHGEGVCPHEHSPVHFAWDKIPTCTSGGIERIVCSVCGYGAIVPVPPCHTYNIFNYCVFCLQPKPLT